jgi:hypothetical protein
MAQQINLYDWETDIQGIGLEDGLLGLAGQVIRVKSDETGLEWSSNGILAVAATSPLFVSGTTTRTIGLAGLTGFGTPGQVVVNLGTVWGYQSTTGTGNIVRSASPTLSGTVAGNLTWSGTQTLTSLAGTAFRMVQAASNGELSTLGFGTAGQALRINGAATGWEYFTPDTGDITAVTGTTPIIVSSGTGPIPNVTISGLTTVGTSDQVITSNGSTWAYTSSTGTGNIVRAAAPTLTGAVLIGAGSGANSITINGGTGTPSPIFFKQNGTDTFDMGVSSDGDTWQVYSYGTSATVLSISRVSGAATFANALDVTGQFSSAAVSQLANYGGGSYVVKADPNGGTPLLGFFGVAPVGFKAVTEWTDTAFANPVTQTASFNTQMGHLITWIQQMQSGLGNDTGYGLLNLT